MPSSYKKSLVSPLLKKKNLDTNDLANYRPISNLSYFSKVIERAVSYQIVQFLESNNLLDPQQSAYRNFHSCETAILSVLNHSLLAMDSKCVTILVLLDLSAAFDSVHHSILSQRLRKCGITDLAHDWIMSYLSGRTQTVVFAGHESSPISVSCGVPQGSVLGPLLFLIYLTGLRDVISPFSINYTLYADDLQLYVSAPVSHLPFTILNMQDCVVAIKAWMAGSLLTLNDSKTECLLMGTPAMLKKCTVTHLRIGSIDVPFSTSVRDLGVIVDQNLDLKSHISSVCAKSFMRLRLVSRLRKSLSVTHYSLLTNALVLSNLEYCSSILLGLPHSSLHRLQQVINATFRSVHSLKKFDHISEKQKLNSCLTMEQRILLRASRIIFTALSHSAPIYICHWLKPHDSVFNLRSVGKGLLSIPRVNTCLGDRAFSVSGPKLWNTLPEKVRESLTLTQLLNRIILYFSSPSA
jgi:hypothetical protein